MIYTEARAWTSIDLKLLEILNVQTCDWTFNSMIGASYVDWISHILTYLITH